MPLYPIHFDASPIDPSGPLARVRVGGRVSVHVELAESSPGPAGATVELDATVKRHGRGGGTALMVADGIEFAMDGDRYPAGGGCVRGELTEVPFDERPPGLAPVEGVVVRIRALRSASGGFRLDEVDEVPRGRDRSAAAADVLGYVVDVSTQD